MFSMVTFLVFENGGVIEQNLSFSIINIFIVVIPAFLSPFIGIIAAKSEKINVFLDNIKFKIQKKLIKIKLM